MASTDQIEKKSSFPYSLVISALGLLALIFSLILRIEPQLMKSDVLIVLHITSENLNEISLHYQYSIIAALFVAGIVIDFVGPRTTLILAIIAEMVGNYIFSNSITSVPLMMAGRIIISHAHPFILISAITLGAQWLPRRHFTFYVGLVFALLLTIPTITKSLLNDIVSVQNLHTTMLGTNIFAGIIIFILLLTVLSPANELDSDNTFDEVISTLRYSSIWGICIVSLLGWTFNTFLLNYGADYLVNVVHFDSENVGETIQIAFTCFACGAIFFGICADFFIEKCIFIIIGYIVAAFTLSIILFVPHLSVMFLATLLFLTGFFSGTATIAYAKAYDLASFNSAGTAFGLMAAITTLGNNLTAKGLGTLFEIYIKNPATAPVSTWQLIAVIVPILLFIGAILAIKLRFKPIKIE